jgi:hypothetical protein
MNNEVLVYTSHGILPYYHALGMVAISSKTKGITYIIHGEILISCSEKENYNNRSIAIKNKVSMAVFPKLLASIRGKRKILRLGLIFSQLCCVRA